MAATIRLPPLVPRPWEPVAPVVSSPWLVPTHNEWVVVYPELERLYVRDRRKLRYIMQYMEREHGFKATQQQYKKRFAKWGFQKNFRRSTAAVPNLTTRDGLSRKPSPLGELTSLPPSLGLDHHDGLVLKVLTSVRICSAAFFESVQPPEGLLALCRQPPLSAELWSEQTQEISFAFKLVMDLLDRGHGDLAGRMARKAFLLVEDMLVLEGPALVWNLLEVMHNMVTLRHARLFQMLLAHLIALSEHRISVTHPFSAMLHGLRALAATLEDKTFTTGSSVSTSSASSPSSYLPPLPSSGDRTTTASITRLSSCALPALLERAWCLNAEILFNHFDSSLFPLYCQVHWDSCSIGPPAAILDAASRWFGRIETQNISSAVAEALRAHDTSEVTSLEQDRMLKHLLAPRTDVSPPRDYEMLRTSSFAALREHADSILNRRVGLTGDTNYQVLRILAGLVTAKVFEDSNPTAKRSSTAGGVRMKVPRKHAGHLACALRTLMHLNIDHSDDRVVRPRDVVAGIRSIVALREYAGGEIAPQLVRDMWQLQDALVAAGENEEAQQVGQLAFRRLEMYVWDIPVESA